MRRSEWSPDLLSDPRVSRWMEKANTRAIVNFFHDHLTSAFLEICRIEEEYEKEIQKLQAQLKSLQARFSKDSHNSSLPPSSDGLKKPAAPRTQSLRSQGGKKPGAQAGHQPHFRGHEAANEIRVYRLEKCFSCRRILADVPLKQHEVRQVIDLHQGRKWVIEHRAEMKLCPDCNRMNHAGFPSCASAYTVFGSEVKRIALYLMAQQLLPSLRIVEFFQDIFGLKLSEGALFSWAIKASRALKNWECQTQVALTNADVAHFDETGVRSQGKLQWLHTASSLTHTLYFLHRNRGSKAIEEFGILSQFKGIAVHDGYNAYWAYTDNGITHALCNAHHLRELVYVHEVERKSWALKMKQLLQEAIHHLHVDHASQQWVNSVRKRYQKILREAYRSYGRKIPRHARAPRAGPRCKRDQGHNLLIRLHYYQDETLRFLTNPLVPFTNNLAEQDLRMLKVKQKISGCFRSLGGAKSFFRIRSFLSTARKQGKSGYEALAEVFPPIQIGIGEIVLV